MSMGTVEGRLASILTVERTALNFLCHLSGVATHTRRFVDAVAAYGGGARVWDTRKTTPGLRALEKAAVRAGGGANHRGNLSDWVMLKDNHLAHMGIDDAVRQARHRWPGRLVHVECDREEQVEAALAAGADAVLLDNMKPDQVRSCVALVHDIVARTRGRRPLLEVSGGITLDNVGGLRRGRRRPHLLRCHHQLGPGPRHRPRRALRGRRCSSAVGRSSGSAGRRCSV